MTNDRLDLKKFFEFYLDNLNQYKSIRCTECEKKNVCRGISLDKIHDKGLKVLKPIK